jgi:hypothetical protein
MHPGEIPFQPNPSPEAASGSASFLNADPRNLEIQESLEKLLAPPPVAPVEIRQEIPYDNPPRQRRPLPPLPNQGDAQTTRREPFSQRWAKSLTETIQRRPAVERSGLFTASTHRETGGREGLSPEVVSEKTRLAYERQGLFVPRFLKDALGRRATDAFIHRVEKVKDLNNALRCAQSITQEYNQQVPYGLHPAHLHLWESRVNQARAMLQRVQRKGFTSVEDFSIYNAQRLDQSLRRMKEHLRLSDQSYQRLMAHKEALLETTRVHASCDLASSSQHLDNVREGLKMAWTTLYSRKMLNMILTPEREQMVKQRFGLSAGEFRDTITSGRYLPIESKRAKAYHFSWKGPDGKMVIRALPIEEKRAQQTNTVDTQFQGVQQDAAILQRCGALEKVVPILPPDVRYQCHGLTYAAGDVSLSYRDVTDLVNTRFQRVQNWKDAKPGDTIVYFTNSGRFTSISHTGTVVSNKGGDIVMFSKFNKIGGFWMHRPRDVQEVFGTPFLYTSNHPAGRFLFPDYTVDLVEKAQAGYV